MKVLE